MLILKTIYLFVYYGVAALTVAGILLIILRAVFNYADVNPFTWSAINIKRSTDPIILPIRRMLVSRRLDPVIAPILAAVILLVVAVLVVQLVGGTLNTIAGIMYAVTSGVPKNVPVAILGYLLYALLGLYELLIFVRIVGSWFSMTYANRWMRFLIRITEPLLAPLRRMIPPVRMFDVSPIVAFIILWILQSVVAGTLLRQLPVQFFQ
jgi:YggT family protein